MIKKIDKSSGLSSSVVLRTVEDVDGKGNFIVTSNGLCYVDSSYHVRLLDNFPYYNNYDIEITGNGKLFVLGSAGIYVVDRIHLLSGE